MHPDERGFALVAAIASILLFAGLALAVLNWTRRSVVTGTAEVQSVRAAEAAESGIVLALGHLLTPNPARRWTLDGRHHSIRYLGAQLDISIIDERGKVPLNLLEQDTASALLEVAGLSGDSLRIARDSLLDWIDDDDDPRPDGAERGFYKAQGIAPRNGPVQTIEELGRIRGFDASRVARLRPIVTADFGAGSFDTRFAQPAAIAIMSGKSFLTPEAIQRTREAAGQTTALGFIGETALVARPITISVRATMGDDIASTRHCIVELTGNAARPYVVRRCGSG